MKKVQKNGKMQRRAAGPPRVEILEDDEPEVAAGDAGEACCRVCGTKRGVQRCGRCRAVFYCGVLHQSADWPVHRRACQAAVVSGQEGHAAMLSLTTELLKRVTHTVEVQLLLVREGTSMSIQTPMNDGVVFTVDDLIVRILRAVSEARDDKLDPQDKWQMFRKHQDAPLDRDDVLTLLNLANFETLTLKLQDDPYVLRVRTTTVKEMAAPDPNQSLILEGIPEDAMLGDVLLFIKKKFNTQKLVLLKKPGHASCIKNPKKQMRQFRHYDYLLAEYASPETFVWRLTLWDRVVMFGYRNWTYLKLLLMLLLLALMGLCVYILLTNLPRKELIA